jgi:hypothetical protein
MSTIIFVDGGDEFKDFRSPRDEEESLSRTEFYFSLSLIENWLTRRSLGHTKLILKVFPESPDNRPMAAKAVEDLVGINDLPLCGCAVRFYSGRQHTDKARSKYPVPLPHLSSLRELQVDQFSLLPQLHLLSGPKFNL